MVDPVNRWGTGGPMIADRETNVVFVADTLERSFPGVYRGLASIFGGSGIPLRTIPGTKQVWCRDSMPIQVAENRFVQFRYAPDYLTGRDRHLRTDGEIGPRLPWLKNCVRSEIVLDGGNVVGWGDKVILTEKVLAENPRWRRRELLAELERVLEVNRVILIPTEPGDVVGHADGVVRFVGGDTVFVNDYRIVDGHYGAALRRVLRRVGLDMIQLPYRPWTGRSRGIPSAFGCYINYLQVGRVVVLPHYALPVDDDVLGCVQRSFPDLDVLTLDCSDLSAEGGVLNCVTWTVLSGEDRRE